MCGVHTVFVNEMLISDALVEKKKAQYKGILIRSYCSALFLVPTKVSLLYMHIHLQEKCTEKTYGRTSWQGFRFPPLICIPVMNVSVLRQGRISLD